MAAPSLFSTHPLRRGPRRWRTCPRSPSTACSATPPPRPTTSPWCWCTAAGRRARGVLTKLRKLGRGHRGEVRGAHGPRSSPASSTAEVRRHGATHRHGRRRRSWSRPSARTSARCRRRPTSWPTTSRASRSTDREGQALLRRPGRGEVVRGRRRRLLRAARRRRSRSCAGRSTAAPPPVLVTSAFAGSARAGWPATCRRRAGCARPTWPARSGVPPWKLRTIRDQSRGWSDRGIARAIRAVAQADADIKGAGQRRVVHAGAAGAHRRPGCATPADGRRVRDRSDVAEMQKGAAPGGSAPRAGRAASERGGLLRRSPTCGWRPGSCG